MAGAGSARRHGPDARRALPARAPPRSRTGRRTSGRSAGSARARRRGSAWPGRASPPPRRAASRRPRAIPPRWRSAPTGPPAGRDSGAPAATSATGSSPAARAPPGRSATPATSITPSIARPGRPSSSPVDLTPRESIGRSSADRSSCGAGLPSPMDPEPLRGMGPDLALDRLRVAGGVHLDIVVEVAGDHQRDLRLEDQLVAPVGEPVDERRQRRGRVSSAPGPRGPGTSRPDGRGRGRRRPPRPASWSRRMPMHSPRGERLADARPPPRAWKWRGARSARGPARSGRPDTGCRGGARRRSVRSPPARAWRPGAPSSRSGPSGRRCRGRAASADAMCSVPRPRTRREQRLHRAEEEPAALHGRDPEVLEGLPRQGCPRGRGQGVAEHQREVVQRDPPAARQEPVGRAPEPDAEPTPDPRRESPHEPADQPRPASPPPAGRPGATARPAAAVPPSLPQPAEERRARPGDERRGRDRQDPRPHDPPGDAPAHRGEATSRSRRRRSPR